MALLAAGALRRMAGVAFGSSSAVVRSLVVPCTGSMLAASAQRVAPLAPLRQQAPARGMALKIKSSVKKRFRVSGSGHLIRMKSDRRHLNMHKSSTRINRLGKKNIVTTSGIRKKYLKILGLSPLLGR